MRQTQAFGFKLRSEFFSVEPDEITLLASRGQFRFNCDSFANASLQPYKKKMRENQSFKFCGGLRMKKIDKSSFGTQQFNLLSPVPGSIASHWTYTTSCKFAIYAILQINACIP